MANQVSETQRMQVTYGEDEAALLLYMHAMKAALEDALKEKHRATELYEASRADWGRKLKDRHKEVRVGPFRRLL